GWDFRSTWFNIKELVWVAFGTASSFASIPVSIKTLETRVGIRGEKAKMIVPLGVNLNPQGGIMYMLMAVLFLAQLYQVPVTWDVVPLVFLGSILSAVAAAGTP